MRPEIKCYFLIQPYYTIFKNIFNLSIIKTLNNHIYHFFFATLLFCLALNNFDSLLLKETTLNLSKSLSSALLVCLAYDLPIELSLKVFCTFYFAIAFLNLPEVMPRPTLKTCLVSWSLLMGIICLAIPSPSIKTLLSLIISTIVASFPSRGPKLILATLPTWTNLL